MINAHIEYLHEYQNRVRFPKRVNTNNRMRVKSESLWYQKLCDIFIRVNVETPGPPDQASYLSNQILPICEVVMTHAVHFAQSALDVNNFGR